MGKKWRPDYIKRVPSKAGACATLGDIEWAAHVMQRLARRFLAQRRREKKAGQMLLAVFRYRQKVKRFQQNVNATIIQIMFRSYLIHKHRRNVMKLQQVENQLKLVTGKYSPTFEKSSSTEIRGSNSFNINARTPKGNSNLKRALPEDKMATENSGHSTLLSSPFSEATEDNNAVNDKLINDNDLPEKVVSSFAKTLEQQSLQTGLSLVIDAPEASNVLYKTTANELSEKMLRNKVQSLKLELQIVKKRYELGLIDTPRKK